MSDSLPLERAAAKAQFKREINEQIEYFAGIERHRKKCIEQDRKDQQWQEKVKNFFGVPDEDDMALFQEHKTWAGENNWMRQALIVLRTVIKHQNKDGTHEVPNDYYEQNADLLETCRTLLHDDFIRTVPVSEGAFPQRITTKGLALYSVLDNLLVDVTPKNLTETECALLRQSQSLKVLAALMGVAR